MKIVIATCRVANEDHAERLRQYAHVAHHRDVICVAEDFFKLPAGHQAGILAHEIGHMLGDTDSEEEADRQANTAFGIRIRYHSTKWGRELEWLPRSDVDWFYQFVKRAGPFKDEGGEFFVMDVELPKVSAHAS